MKEKLMQGKQNLCNRREFLFGSMSVAGMFASGCASFQSADAADALDPDLAVFISDLHINGLIEEDHREVFLRRTVRDILALRPRPSNVVCLGDIAYLWGMPEDYVRVKGILRPLYDAGIKVTLGMGNHDRRDRFLEQWPEYAKSSPIAGRIVSKVEMPRVSIIVLDSLNARPIEYKKGTFPGELDDAQREWLAAELSAATKPVFVCAHHGIKEDNVALASTVVNAKACKGYVNGHWHRWRNDYAYASHRGRFLKHVCLPSTGHWGDIGFATFRAFGDRAVMSLTQVDYFNGRPGDSQPEREFVLQERKGAFATFSLS